MTETTPTPTPTPIPMPISAPTLTTEAATATDAASTASPGTGPGPAALPDRLSADPRSQHHVAAAFEREVGIRFNDKERFDVEEYCISEGWIRVPVGKQVDRKGQPLTIKLKGRVQAFHR